jgi:nucleotide-binding universal stress UspA family protein
MFKDILIPTDGSEGAQRGIEHALDIGEKYGARIHTLYVVDEGIYATPALSGGELFLEELQESGETACEEVVSAATDRGLDAVSECVRGRPHREILDYAADHDIDLIVMGKHGASNHRHHHIGSCTDRVIRLADVPVLPV